MEYKGIEIKPGVVITTKGEPREYWVVSVGGVIMILYLLSLLTGVLV